MPFPTAKDYHKPGKPEVPNCYGIFYALTSVCYWFVLYFLETTRTSSGNTPASSALALATSVLFGSTMGLFDDMVDLPWRYKAILPVFASLPYMVLRPSDRTTMSALFLGIVHLGELFFILIVPIIVTVTTNTYNQLGGLNGLESLSGLTILIGFTLASGDLTVLIVPIACLLVLGYFNFQGRFFIGNVGSFSIGLTLAVYAILMNLKLFLLISLTPFLINSILILFSNYVLHEKADTLIDDHGLLYALKVRSLRTLILRVRHLSERATVILICCTVILSTTLALLIQTIR
jgi:UDP-N-acetylmuramyl pentapeptide phosphotransferase/UDP-N-acetylglucosamine-1-phosphate transferase